MGRKLATSLCLIGLIGLLGCSDSSNGLLVAPDDTTGAAQAISGEVIEPALEALNRFELDEVLSGGPPAARGTVGQECTDYSDACSTGALELCFDSIGQTYDFTDCATMESGAMFDGTIAEADGSVTFDLAVDDVTYAGTVSLVYGKGCVTESMTGFAVTTSSSTTSVSGELTYCEGNDRPSGTATFTTEGSVGSWRIDLTMNGTDVASAVVTSLTTQVSDTCTIDFATDQATCGLT